MKRCRSCGMMKPLDEFHRDPNCKDGRRSECAICRNMTPAKLFKTNLKSRAHYAILRAMGIPSEEATQSKTWSIIKIAQTYIPGFSKNDDA